MDLLQLMRVSPVIPVIQIDRLEHAVPLAQALVRGGIRVLEVTLRTKHGLSAIMEIVDKVPDAIVGVGTVTRGEEFEQARAVGAVFAVSPGLTEDVVAGARACSLPLLPGVMTPSEVMFAREQGFKQLKLFPAVPAGGVGMLNALAGPLGDVTFCPTGGITPASALSFLACRNVACVGGSWLTPADAIAAGDWERISGLAREAAGLREKLAAE